jgi:hypothetical protein
MSSKASLSGSLNFLSLVDLLQLLGSNGSSGVLRIKSKYASGPGIVYFTNGNPIDASSGSAKGLDALYTLFGWSEGEFEFSREDIDRKKVITNTRMEVILDGLKKLDDGQIEKLGPDALVKTVKDSGGGLSLPLIKGPLIDYNYVVEEEEYRNGAKIVEQGKHGSWVWVILEGVVDIVKETPQGPLTIVKIGTGAFIGSLATFLLEGHKRSASAIASGKVQLGVLDSQRISSEYARISSGFKGVLRSLENRLIQVTNRLIDIHSGNDRLNEFIKERKLIVKQGSKNEKLYRITAGNAYVLRTIENVHVPLAKISIDDYFGFFPFLDAGHESFSASVFGTEDLAVRPIDVNSLQKEYDQLSSTFKHIIENMAMRISVTTKIACDLKIGNEKKQA